jgi:hypothetical protein
LDGTVRRSKFAGSCGAGRRVYREFKCRHVMPGIVIA